jgi:bacterioferritin-associated ferredoxin
LPEAFAHTKWDHVYVTSLFTLEWARTIDAVEYAKTLVDSIDQITVGGIAATMLPDDMYRDTGIHPVCGLLNEPGKLGLPGDECIDQSVPDYSILDDIDYVYPFHDAYFLSATKGCGNKCGSCAVQTLEPKFIPYIDIKEKIAAIDAEFGPKKDLLLMDNNVLRSSHFNQIIDDIIAAGFGKDAYYINPKTGKAAAAVLNDQDKTVACRLLLDAGKLTGSGKRLICRNVFENKTFAPTEKGLYLVLKPRQFIMLTIESDK